MEWDEYNKKNILIKRRQSTARYSPHRLVCAFLAQLYTQVGRACECWGDITVKALKHCGKIYWKKIKSQFDKKEKRIYRKKTRKKKFICETLERERARPENLFITFWFVVVVLCYNNSNAAFFRYHHGVRVSERERAKEWSERKSTKMWTLLPVLWCCVAWEFEVRVYTKNFSFCLLTSTSPTHMLRHQQASKHGSRSQNS